MLAEHGQALARVRHALGSAEAATCAQGIPTGATVDIALLIQAVNHSLGGCSVST